MQADLLRTLTPDGLRLDGALLAGNEVASRPVDAALCLHGVGANFYTCSALEAVAPALRKLGISVLFANTRGHDSLYTAAIAMGRRRQGAAVEIVDECRLDVAGWCKFLVERGMQRILLVGHSLGAIKAVYSQAHEPNPSVVGLIAASPPRLSCQAFKNSLESTLFFDSLSTAEQLVKAGRGDELFLAKFPFPLLMSGTAYVDKYGPGERYNILDFAGRVPVPALFTYGSKELETGGIAFAGLAEALAKLPEKRGPLTVEVISGADHNYTGCGESLAAAMSKWIERNYFPQ
ncbi:MAG: alpha/beta fold hydrolase [Pirellulaceae bacterium]